VHELFDQLFAAVIATGTATTAIVATATAVTATTVTIATATGATATGATPATRTATIVASRSASVGRCLGLDFVSHS
jgi:hypothetical protein